MATNGNGLKVALIATQFPNPAETFISARARTLVELGCEVEVHSVRPEHPRASELARERDLTRIKWTHTQFATLWRGTLQALARPVLLARFLSWVVGATLSNPRHLAKCLTLTPRAFEILGHLERWRPDVVHAEWCHYPALVVWLAQQRLPGTVTSIGLIAHDLDTALGCTIAATRAADLVRSSTRENVAQIVAFTGVAEERVEVIYDGVDVEAVDAAVDRSSKEPGAVAVVARLSEEKRISHAIRAFALVATEVPSARLHILGDGPERNALVDLVSKLGLSGRVDFLGHVRHDQVLDALARTEVLVLLSETERLPNVVKEGMAARCVCVTTRTNGITEMIEDGVTGFILEHDQIEEAGRRIVWALRETEAAQRLGAAARLSVGERFDHVKNVERFLAAWTVARRSR